MTLSLRLALAGAAIVATVWGAAACHSRQNVVTAGFWVDDSVTFALPHLARLGGPLSPAERARIVSTARQEIGDAFRGLRLVVSGSSNAFYRVRLVQILVFHRTAVSGQSNVFGLLGGSGAVSFETLASQAIARAPADADRAAIVAAIGRGIGRAAVHELTHQLFPRLAIHASRDPNSYEYWNSARTAQYYGPIRWDVAWPYLLERLGPDTSAPQARGANARRELAP